MLRQAPQAPCGGYKDENRIDAPGSGVRLLSSILARPGRPHDIQRLELLGKRSQRDVQHVQGWIIV